MVPMRLTISAIEKTAGGEYAWLTQVMSREAKKSIATLVYPQAALFASRAALLFRCEIEPIVRLNFVGAEAMLTEYCA